MFDNIKDYLSPRTFSIIAYLCMIIHFHCGVIFSAILKSVRDGEMEKFSCAVNTNYQPTKTYVEKECFAMYDEIYNSPVRFSSFVPFSFISLIVVSFAYWFFVSSRVDEMEKLLNERKKSKTLGKRKNKEQDRKFFYVFKLYLGHLMARFVLGLSFSILQQTLLYPSGFKTVFDCVYQALLESNLNTTASTNRSVDLSNVGCKNFTAPQKQFYGTIVVAFNIIFAVFALLEVFYLIYHRCSEKSWSCDSEFVAVYFLHQRYDREKSQLTKVVEDYSTLTKSEIYKKEVLEISLTPDINYGPNTSLDEMFIDIVIQAGQAPHKFSRNMDRHEIYDVYMKVPKDSIRLEKIEDLFYPNSDTRGKLPRTILALGRPGIGKTVLTRKIMRDWARGIDAFYSDKIAFFFKFRWFNFEEWQNLTLKEFLRFGSELEEDEFESLLDEISIESKNVILIFDGFDEGVSNLQEFQNCLDRARKYSNDPDVSMSAMLLFIKLMLGHLVKDVTILVTSRPTASEFYSKFTFHRKVEILGFTSEKIENYVEAFCVNNNRPDLKPEIWSHITSSSERMNLCYIPVNCFIVCVTLFNRLVDLTNNSPLPTRLTELYESALVYFNRYHDRNENDNDLKKLQEMAFFGVENDMLVFPGQSVNTKMKECGLMHCLPNPSFQIQAQFCFIHLTVQEFLAAKHIVETKRPRKIKQFINSHFKEGKWHLVLQFLAGLLGRKIKTSVEYRCCVSSFAHHFEVKTDGDDVECLLTRNTVLGMKCISEMENDEIAAETATTSALKGVANLYMENTSTLKVSPSDCSSVVFVCKHLKMLTSFYVYGLNKDCLVEVTKLLQERCIETLHFCTCNFEDFGLQNVLDALKSNCHLDHEHSELTTLSLRFSKITDAGLLQLCQYLNVHRSRLEVLELSGNQITSSGMSEFSGVLSSEAGSRLEVLNLWSNDIGDDGACCLFQALLESQSKLGSLDLSVCSLTSECITWLAKALCDECSEITDLSLFSNELIGDTGVRILCEAFQTRHCKLAGLSLGKCSLTDKCIPFLREAIERGQCSLTKLCISSNAIGDCGGRMLFEALKTEQCKLAELNLRKCSLTDECMPTLCQALGDKHCKLTYLNVERNKFTDTYSLLLFDVLKLEDCPLRYLCIKKNRFTRNGKLLLRHATEFKHCKAMEAYI